MRTRKTDTKLVVPARSALARSLEAQFDGGPIVSLQELAHHAQVRKLSDSQKKSFCIIQFSFVLLNRRGEPRTIRRGAAHQITKGRTVLHSFSPVEISHNNYPKTLDDVKELLEKNMKVNSSKYSVRPMAIVRNLRKGIRYYFVLFAVEFTATAAAVASLESDVFEGHLPVTGKMSASQERKLAEVMGKRVDALAVQLLRGTKPAISKAKDELRTIAEEGGKLHDGLFLPFGAFISHASADKKSFVRPLVKALGALNVKPWFDEKNIRDGASIRRSIREGLNLSRVCVIVFSRNYHNRFWTEEEADAFFEQASRLKKRIVVVACGISPSEVGRYDPILGSKLIINGSLGAKTVAKRIRDVLNET